MDVGWQGCSTVDMTCLTLTSPSRNKLRQASGPKPTKSLYQLSKPSGPSRLSKPFGLELDVTARRGRRGFFFRWHLLDKKTPELVFSPRPFLLFPALYAGSLAAYASEPLLMQSRHYTDTIYRRKKENRSKKKEKKGRGQKGLGEERYVRVGVVPPRDQKRKWEGRGFGDGEACE